MEEEFGRGGGGEYVVGEIGEDFVTACTGFLTEVQF